MLGPRPVVPFLHRLGFLPARLSARALGPEPWAQAARRQDGAAAGPERAGVARDWCIAQPIPQAGQSMSRCSPRPSPFLSDRCRPGACGYQGAPPSDEKHSAVAPSSQARSVASLALSVSCAAAPLSKPIIVHLKAEGAPRSLLPQRPRSRCCQRYPLSRRLQLPPHLASLRRILCRFWSRYRGRSPACHSSI